MQIRPIRNQVVLEVIKPVKEEVSQGGILLPTQAQENERPTKGKFIDAGQEVTEELRNVKVGDTLLFGKNARGETFKDQGIEYVIMNDEYILGVVI